MASSAPLEEVEVSPSSPLERFDAGLRARLRFLPYDVAHDGPSRFFLLVHLGLLLACVVDALTAGGGQRQLSGWLWAIIVVLLPGDLFLPSKDTALAFRVAYLAAEGGLMLLLGWLQGFDVVGYLLLTFVGQATLILPVSASACAGFLIMAGRLSVAAVPGVPDGGDISADAGWIAGAVFVWFAVSSLRTGWEQRRRIAALANDLTAAERQLREQAAALEREVQLDPLTGVHNRRYMEQDLSREFDRSKRFGHDLALAILDVDSFKIVNDDHSHELGDLVLVHLATLLRAACRSIDSVVRLGGDEFVLYFPESSLETARGICERLRQSILDADWAGLGLRGPLTVSIGLAAASAVRDQRELLSEADKKLREAKQLGKNRIAA